MERNHGRLKKILRKNWQMYALLLPVFAYIILFAYVPMYGIQIAFKDFSPRVGIMGSDWVGLEHFQRFFSGYYFGQLVGNTVSISLLTLVVGFPAPIILAILLNEVRSSGFRRVVQTVTYAPHFISMVVMCGMIFLFLSPQSGLVNVLIKACGGEPVYFMGQPEYFKAIYVITDVWQNAGWSSVIYMAALSGIDPQIHEAAKIDGAGRLRRIWCINLPGILPTIIILLIMNCGSIMSVGFEKIFLLQNDLNRSASDVISTFVYRQGLLLSDYSFSTAVGLFNSVINFALLVTVNWIASKTADISFW